MDILNLLKSKRTEILRLASKHGARNVRIFGSVARGDADENSDIDFLVAMDRGGSLLNQGALLAELEALLGRPVDVADERDLRPRVRERIIAEAVPI